MAIIHYCYFSCSDYYYCFTWDSYYSSFRNAITVRLYYFRL